MSELILVSTVLPRYPPSDSQLTRLILQITGVSGYIGFKTLILALEAGYKVRAVVRKSEQIPKLQSHQRLQAHQSQLSFMVVPDLTDASSVSSNLVGVTGIIHLASPLAIEVN